ncbi:MAG: GDP-mannose 4,6-dehydratase [Candidatus Omnitrophota bacterium]
MKVLITGIAGFVGSHLSELLIEKKYDLYGIERRGADTANIEHLMGSIRLYSECDINDFDATKKILNKIKPDFVIHLAAQASLFISWKAPVDTIETNVVGQVKLFEALRSLKLNPRIILAGSCEEYGSVKREDIPIKETCPLRPLNTYAVSKVAQDYLGYQYYKSYGLDIIRTRPFHQTGPRRSKHFVCSNFARQIALIEKGRQEAVMYVGNLKAERDFSDVRDMVNAYWHIMKKGRSGDVYNICSGKGYTIKKVLDMLLSMTEKKVKVKQDLKRIRLNDVPLFIGDCAKMKRLTGWKPVIPFEKTLNDLLNYWRDRT